MKEFKDCNKINYAFVEITGYFGIEKDEMERKLKKIICHFSREIKKEKDNFKFDNGTEKSTRVNGLLIGVRSSRKTDIVQEK